MNRLIGGARPHARNIPEDAPLEERVAALIEALDGYIEAYHGGTVELVDFDGACVRVRFGGACKGCPQLEATLHGWIEGTLKEFFPEIECVTRVE